MLKRIIPILCAAALIAALFAGCAKKDDAQTTSAPAVDPASVSDSASVSEDAADTDRNAEHMALLTGSWEDGSVRYTFKEDGTGSVADKATDTGTPFEFALDAQRGVITLRLGSPDNSEDIDYNFSNVFTLNLRYPDGKIVTLTRAARENPLLGTWANDEVRYFFMSDGTGVVEDIETDMGTAFNYALSDEDGVFTIYFDGADNGEKTLFETSEDGTLVLTFADGKVVTLTRVEE